jgi:hypothetical protein
VSKQFGVQRVSKLVLMLSSSHDGEIVSAARAISRMLKSSGTNWHDLVACLTQPRSHRTIVHMPLRTRTSPKIGAR